MSKIGLRYLSEISGRNAKDMGALAESLYREQPESSPAEKSHSSKKAPASALESYDRALKRYKEERGGRS